MKSRITHNVTKGLPAATPRPKATPKRMPGMPSANPVSQVPSRFTGSLGFQRKP